MKQEKIKRMMYSGAALALCGLTLFTFWISNRGNSAKTDESSTTTPAVSTTSDTEIQANTPVTNVEDDRYSVPPTEEKRSVFFAYPLGNGISREYSKGELVKNKTTDDWRTHNGVDINGTLGDPVKAMADGTVTMLRIDELWGTVITIDHGEGITAEYRGLQKDSTLEPGDTVKANGQIGTLGEIPIEKADGIHLHLEIYKNGSLVSPADYLNKRVEI